MDSVQNLIVGAGISGLATGAFLNGAAEALILEADAEIGGYCKTVRREGFVWDYSGHFFHFKHPEIEAWLRARMPGQEVRTIIKRSFVRYHGRDIDFPFQKNIHQLPQEEFIDCLYDLYFADGKAEPRSFREMLYSRFGRAIAEKFLIPYNEKLYACDLGQLDVDAMGRFFPHASFADVMRNLRQPDNASYNATFSYPAGGAIEYVKALASEIPPGGLALGEPLTAVDLERRIATTPRRQFRFERLISSAPFPRLLRLCGVAYDPSLFTWNKVLVFNLGFDQKGPRAPHWIYFPDRARAFYRVGFYDNIFDTERMSLYVELGFARDAAIDVDAARARVLDGLRAEGIVTDHRLVAEHHVVMDPAYVHITRASIEAQRRLSAELAARGVYSIGRYGGWTYCSIEDNIVEARALATRLTAPALAR
jgi:protoporphyrinogen oxidase